MNDLDLLFKYLKANVNMPAADEAQLRTYFEGLVPEEEEEEKDNTEGGGENGGGENL